MHGKVRHNVAVSATDTVGDIKTELQRLTNVPAKNQKLMLKKKQLKDDTEVFFPNHPLTHKDKLMLIGTPLADLATATQQWSVPCNETEWSLSMDADPESWGNPPELEGKYLQVFLSGTREAETLEQAHRRQLQEEDQRVKALSKKHDTARRLVPLGMNPLSGRRVEQDRYIQHEGLYWNATEYCDWRSSR